MKPLRSSILPFNHFSVSCKHSKKGIIQGGSSWRFTKKQRCSLSKFISLSDINVTPVYISWLQIFFLYVCLCLTFVRLEFYTVFIPDWESWALNWYMQNCLGWGGDLSISNQDYLTSTTSLIDAYGLVGEVFWFLWSNACPNNFCFIVVERFGRPLCGSRQNLNLGYTFSP